MAMIRKANLDTSPQGGKILDLGDLGARGEALVNEATQEAEKILREARAERDRLMTAGKEEGYKAGHAEGLAAGHAEGIEKGMAAARESHSEVLAVITTKWQQALDQFEGSRSEMLDAARAEIIRLAALIATRVTHRTVDLNPKGVLDQVEAVLASVTKGSSLTVRLHPDDCKLAEVELPAMLGRLRSGSHVDVVADDSLEPGSCVAALPTGGEIDATVRTQLGRIIRELLPDGGGLQLDRPEETETSEQAPDTLRGDAA